MTRFLSLIAILSLIYLSALLLGDYDADISIGIFDYVIKVSLFLILTFLIFLIALFSLGMKLLTWIVSFPISVISRISGSRKNYQTRLLLEAYALIIMDNKSDARKKLSKFEEKELEKIFSDHVNLLKALSSDEVDKDLINKLSSKKEYYRFASKRIFFELLKQGHDSQALKFAENIELNKSKDKEVRGSILSLYAKLNVWDQFVALADKFGKKDDLSKLSDPYLAGAKYFLADGQEKMSQEFLEKALEYNPASMAAIEIFCTLNNSQSMNHLNLPILEAAFSIKPSFELFELYCQSISMDSKELYAKFASLIDTKKYRDVMLSIGAYLKLYDEVEALISCEI